MQVEQTILDQKQCTRHGQTAAEGQKISEGAVILRVCCQL